MSREYLFNWLIASLKLGKGSLRILRASAFTESGWAVWPCTNEAYRSSRLKTFYLLHTIFLNYRFLKPHCKWQKNTFLTTTWRKKNLICGSTWLIFVLSTTDMLYITQLQSHYLFAYKVSKMIYFSEFLNECTYPGDVICRCRWQAWNAEIRNEDAGHIQ